MPATSAVERSLALHKYIVFHTVSEYIRSLIRADLEAASRHEVEAQLLEAIERGDYREATPAFWQRMEAAATGKAARKRKPKKS